MESPTGTRPSSPEQLPSPCQSSSMVNKFDFSGHSGAPVLASLRSQVLAYLADLESRLSQLESPISTESMLIRGESTVEEARAWVNTALDMMNHIRDDVCSHLPDTHAMSESVGLFVKSHIPDVPHYYTLDDVRSHASTITTIRPRLSSISVPDMRARLDHVRSSISDIDFHNPLHYIPTLSEHLQSLQKHLSSMDLPHTLSDSLAKITPSTDLVHDLIDRILSSEMAADLREGEEIIEKTAKDLAKAVRASLNGSRLISYVDLPQQWRNNQFVTSGYRFIPIERWNLLFMSLFTLHNETVNIHTHFVPFLVWSLDLLRLSPMWPSATFDTEHELPMLVFKIFALLCLLSSTVWHVMAGCAHHDHMQFCAQLDYIGIGWLICATGATVVYYGLQCHPIAFYAYLGLSISLGISSTILPFTEWFSRPGHRGYRIAFFVCVFLSAFAPLPHFAYVHSLSELSVFIAPVMPSVFSYIAGFVFYITQFPEAFIVDAKRQGHHWLDYLGGGSHGIWHVFVVGGIALHHWAMSEMKVWSSGLDRGLCTGLTA